MTSPSDRPVRIALDAMGTDGAPAADVAGALLASTERSDSIHLVLVGQREKIEGELAKHSNVDRSRISIEDAREVIAMGDEPAQAIRRMRDSSIVRGLEMHRAGAVDAFVSAGNTGAVMAGSTVILGRIGGIIRPTIASLFPSATGFTIVADVGANVDTRPQHLVQFAIMASIYAEMVMGDTNPTVGLLNVGEEPGKGEERAVETHELLKSAPINFVGNVEGRDILKGTARVVVCDGFVGNILLKFAESVPGLLRSRIAAVVERGGILAKLRVAAARGILRSVFKEMDYQEYGGVPLLGVDGVSIIGHGGSTPRAIRGMILKAEEMVRREVNKRIADAVRERE